ncbi:MAG: histidinol-phosphate transaminase [Bacteroidales bacterium]|nr:histidinol-phosphate transaminase [Bacteroidales bacterium]
MDSSIEIKQLVRNNIRELVPYSSARDEYSGSASVFLDANENPYNTPLNRYPDPKQLELKKVIAQIKGQQVANLFLGNGSDEGIDLLFRVLCEPGRDNVIAIDPTYGMYSVCAKINNVDQKHVLLDKDFGLDPNRVLEAVDNRTKMIFLCSPNNPTSNSLEPEAMVRIIDGVNCMVVVDEAYIDFSREQGILSLVPEKKNLVVLQTLSKAWGLAGIRLGMVFAHQELIGYLSGVKYPYNINSLSLAEAMKSLRDTGARENWVHRILEERKKLIEQLKSLAFVKKVYPSDANFLLVQMENPGQVYSYLMEKGIIVRDRSSVPLCDGCLRITVGTETENRQLCNVLAAYDQTLEN